MKKTIVNVGAILVAFCIGLAINNACADSLEKMSDSELRNLVLQLQQEVNSLKQRVAELEGKISSSGGGNSTVTASGFDVDGLHFDNAGFVENPIDYIVQNGYTIVNGVRTEDPTQTVQYSYDSRGRLINQGGATYSYSGKVVTLETSGKADSYESKTTIEYHYK